MADLPVRIGGEAIESEVDDEHVRGTESMGSLTAGRRGREGTGMEPHGDSIPAADLVWLHVWVRAPARRSRATLERAAPLPSSWDMVRPLVFLALAASGLGAAWWLGTRRAGSMGSGRPSASTPRKLAERGPSLPSAPWRPASSAGPSPRPASPSRVREAARRRDRRRRTREAPGRAPLRRGAMERHQRSLDLERPRAGRAAGSRPSPRPCSAPAIGSSGS